jgi:hypothetical protein
MDGIKENGRSSGSVIGRNIFKKSEGKSADYVSKSHKIAGFIFKNFL